MTLVAAGRVDSVLAVARAIVVIGAAIGVLRKGVRDVVQSQGTAIQLAFFFKSRDRLLSFS